MEFSYKKMLGKGIRVFVFFGLPYVISQFLVQMPDLANLTIGAILVMLSNWLKNYVGLKFA